MTGPDASDPTRARPGTSRARPGINRRTFLRVGAAGAAGAVVVACSGGDDDGAVPTTTTRPTTTRPPRTQPDEVERAAEPEPEPEPTPGALTFSESLEDGMGRSNSLAWDPHRADWTVGQDVSGPHRAVGDRWTSWSAGLGVLGGVIDPAMWKVSAVHVLDDGTTLVGVGRPDRGGLARRGPDDAAWTIATNEVWMSGASAGGSSRDVGRKFAASGERAVGNVLVAEGRHGVAVTLDAGRSWRVLDAVEIGSSGRLAADPVDRGGAFLATDALGGLGGRLVHLPDVLDGGDAAPVRLDAVGGAPAGGFGDLADVIAVDEGGRTAVYVYARGGEAGLWRFDVEGRAWDRVDTPAEVVAGVPNGITAVHRDGVTSVFLVAGAPDSLGRRIAAPVEGMTSGHGVWRHRDGTWEGLTPAAAVDLRVYGTDDVWVRATMVDADRGRSIKLQSLLGGTGYTGYQIELHPDATELVTVGKGGVWRTESPLGPVEGLRWQPHVRHLGATIHRTVAVDPARPERVAASEGDHAAMAWARAGDQQPAQLWSVAMAATGSAEGTVVATGLDGVLAGTSHVRENRDGEIHRAAGFGADGPWTPTGMADDLGVDPRPLGLAEWRDASGTAVTLAALEGRGVARRSSGPWTFAPGAPEPSPDHVNHFVTSEGSDLVFWFAPLDGLFRSTDAGRSWELVWDVTVTSRHAGGLAGDPDDPARLYLAGETADGADLWIVEGADSGSLDGDGSTVSGTISASPATGAGGPLTSVTSDPTTGDVYVARAPTATEPTDLLRSSDRGATWESVADTTYREAAIHVFHLAAGGGTVAVATDGCGVLRGVTA